MICSQAVLSLPAYADNEAGRLYCRARAGLIGPGPGIDLNFQSIMGPIQIQNPQKISPQTVRAVQKECKKSIHCGPKPDSQQKVKICLLEVVNFNIFWLLFRSGETQGPVRRGPDHSGSKPAYGPLGRPTNVSHSRASP